MDRPLDSSVKFPVLRKKRKGDPSFSAKSDQRRRNADVPEAAEALQNASGHADLFFRAGYNRDRLILQKQRAVLRRHVKRIEQPFHPPSSSPAASRHNPRI